MNINTAVKSLVRYAIDNEMIEKWDEIWAINTVCQALNMDSFEDCEAENAELEDILASILDYAVENGLCEDSVVYRDLFDTKIMGLLTPRPSEVISKFQFLYIRDKKSATDYYYKLCQDSDYIRRYRIKNDLKWITKTEYGDIDITINLSKPEKDPKAIAAALKMKATSYPKCLLCKENEGYMGRINHPARQNHRIIPMTLGGESFFMQYSPYVYYNEHCIVFNAEHTPMKIDKSAFAKLLDFVEKFPHYFVGSNADLPIVGGSILTHEHFQGGNYEFAMAKAPIETKVTFSGFEDVQAGIVKWPMSVIRIKGTDKARLVELADKVLTTWRGYTDKDSFIYAKTEGTPHNTITPIARMRNGQFELDLVLRNNITTEDCPLGYYHPHPEYHHIKKENIGLIEVMGLAVLPSRLKNEMAVLGKAMVNGEDISANETIASHKEWAEMIMQKYDINEDNIDDILKKEIGIVFTSILGQCGVYSRDEEGKAGFLRFIESVR
ncbi:UDP-glucose--hexose-1-phosphate uridylyltransferase [Eubacterium coprostanoligenes]|uniref:UDP-glucose--hexose-1-phosphate uridylyltransferase n=1 Tax=Eubacterium coprostanoligenes TaxID=290054 RepID=UPI002354510B|nr:UDP-glucose--hexose-1-phosphate uridylyltransferase [Eubacterium coprostanoligenes]MCI6254274.1 UDP-glucose--hexose-1-phosphate uridylyltransferase [Eubacterium coprostanoligenes]MDY5399277.1 UDP-glucose--hexose-1-phosphate uridylyltransferase [Eubacterium coprostanoligenes]